jgi:hypothetical protein
MVIKDSDLQIRKTNHSAGGKTSLGGNITSEVVSEGLQNLWDEVQNSELSSSVVGEYEVRCVGILNNSPNNETFEDLQVYVDQNTAAPFTDIDIALGTAAFGDEEQTVASEDTMPLNVFFTFARGEENALVIGNVPKGVWKALWLRRHAGPARSGVSYPRDNYVLGFKVRRTEGTPVEPPTTPVEPPPGGGGGGGGGGTPSVNDRFGIRMIFPSKPPSPTSSEPWFMDMVSASPHNAGDCRFSSSTTITKNADGSYRTTSTEDLRLHAYISNISGCNRDVIERDIKNLDTYDHSEWAARGYIYKPNDWKNVEITAYYKIIKLKSGVNSGLVDFWIYTRGAIHSANTAEGCGGCAYRFAWSDKADDIGYQKEMYHNSDLSDCGDRVNLGTRIDSGFGNLVGKWFGIKAIIYNTNNDTNVHLETWMDKDNTNVWVKVKEETDSGGVYPGAPSTSCEGGEACGGTRDERFVWGSPLIRFNWRDVAEMHLKNFSVREIQAT